MPASYQQFGDDAPYRLEIGQPDTVQLRTFQSMAEPDDLERTLRRLDVVTSIVGGWIWETDAEHRFVYMSPSVQRISGRLPEWHYGKTRQQLGNLALSTTEQQSWQQQLEARTSFGPVDFIRYMDGHAFQMRTIGHPQFDRNGEFTGYIGVAFALPGDAATEGAERRTEPRRRIVRAAEIDLPGEAATISCVLADISTTGARLRVPADVTLPKEFGLSVPALALRKQCATRWRRGNDVGVAFMA